MTGGSPVDETETFDVEWQDPAPVWPWQSISCTNPWTPGGRRILLQGPRVNNGTSRVSHPLGLMCFHATPWPFRFPAIVITGYPPLFSSSSLDGDFPWFSLFSFNFFVGGIFPKTKTIQRWLGVAPGNPQIHSDRDRFPRQGAEPIWWVDAKNGGYCGYRDWKKIMSLV